MAPIFVDTSVWCSLCDRNDGQHRRAVEFYRNCAARLVTSNLVFAETLSLITKRLGKAHAVRFVSSLRGSGRLQVVHVDVRMEERAWELFEKYADKNWDMIDCCSFVLMELLRATTAFTFDAHFAQRGFTVAP